jgi:aquaporin Z
MLLPIASQVTNHRTADTLASHRLRALRFRDGLSAADSLRLHWPEYLMEAGELGLYLAMACAVATLLQHPASPVQQHVMGGIERRALMGMAMGATIVGIVMSPWGKQSGGHFNPAITFTFYRLRKVEFWDLWFYTAAQFLGAVGGVAVARYMMHGAPGNDAVRYAITVPGIWGSPVAFVAETTISFVLMLTVLFVTNREGLAPYTPYFVGLLMAAYITFEAPLGDQHEPGADVRLGVSPE